MQKSKKPIVEHIKDFLDYCEVERGLSSRTQENYSHYLKKFTTWLSSSNHSTILPHELSSQYIWDYRLYLSRHQDKGKTLAKLTQNYYLIALRALLSYFLVKDVTSLPPDKIALPKDAGKEKSSSTLSSSSSLSVLESEMI